jgi:hypothetical protein
MLNDTKELNSDIALQYCIDDEMQMGNSAVIRKMPIEDVIKWLNDNEIIIVSYPWKFAVENLEIMKKIKDANLLVFSKTRNDIFAPLLQKCGVNVNLVDYLVTENQKKDLEDYKKEYFSKYWDKAEKIFGDSN